MGLSLGGSKSKSKSSSNYKQDVWGGQSPYLQNMYQGAGDLYNQSAQGMSQYVPGAVQDMQGIFQGAMPYWQDQMQGGAYKGMNLQGQYGQALQGGGNEQAIDAMTMGGEGNNYADAMKDQYRADAQRSMDNMNSTLDSRAAGMGMSGSSRHGVAQGIMGRGINDALQKNLAETGYNTFDKDLQRKLGIAQRADRFDMNRLNNVSGMLGQQQTTMNNGLNFGSQMQNMNMGQFAPYNAGWAPMNQYAGVMGDPTILGSGSSSGKGSSGAFGMSI